MNNAASRQRLVAELPDGAASEPRLFRAPGRVNIIGEHTDYTGGFVLPTTTAAYTWAAAAARDDRDVNIRSLNLNDVQSFGLDDRTRSVEPGWIDYAKGVAALIEDNGIRLRGADVVIDSEIPIGGGLSSSAAFEIVIATALLDLAAASMPAPKIAQLCQRAEVEYAGVNCGVMDQCAIACCRSGHAMLLDCRNLETKHVSLPDGIRLLLTDSGIKHALADGDYNRRIQECADATELLSQQLDDFDSLRDLGVENLERCSHALDDTLHRRCRHVASENNRVLDTYAALTSADFSRLGGLISASHESLRDDFEVSCDAVDSLVKIADACDGVFGSRMIGAGFGGCVLSVVDANRIEQTMLKIRNEYRTDTGKYPWMHIVSPTDAAKKLMKT